MLTAPWPAWSQSSTGTPVATVLSSSSTESASTTNQSQNSSGPATTLNMSHQEEIQVLDAIDAQSNSSTAGSTDSSVTLSGQAPLTGTGQQPATAGFAAGSTIASAPVTTPPPTAPTGLSVLILKEGIYLSWDSAPPGTQVSAYTVYRSTTPGMGYKPVNLKTLLASYFLDGLQTSSLPPQNGEVYFYVVSAVDDQGRVSPFSDELAVTPQGMDIPPPQSQVLKPLASPTAEVEKILTIGDKTGLKFQLPADTSLAIQGYKKIEADFAFQKFDRPDENGIPAEVDTTTVNQELVVSLQGKVGKNVDVNVDYSDVNRAGGVDQTKQDISIVYHGDTDSPVQEVAFGNLQLVLPNTEFAGYSKQLFGLQAILKFDNFRFTSFFAQTQGLSATKVFNGNTVQVDKLITDVTYVPLKYFLITRNFIQGSGTNPNTGLPVNNALPLSNSEQIWVDPGNGQIQPIGPNFQGAFEHWLPGRDYTIDYSTGIITFIRTVPSTARIAVAFTPVVGSPVGFSGSTIDLTPTNLKVPDNGIVINSAHLIKDNNNTTGPSSANAIALSPLYLVDYFNLGTDKIVPPQQVPNFLFQIISNGSNDVLQTGQGTSILGSSTPWNPYTVNLDFNYLTVTNFNFTAPRRPHPSFFQNALLRIWIQPEGQLPMMFIAKLQLQRVYIPSICVIRPNPASIA